MRRLKKFAVLLLGVVPGWFHATVTGPALWGHNSSAAFDAWVFLWLMSIIAFVAACCYEPKQSEPQVGEGQKP